MEASPISSFGYNKIGGKTVKNTISNFSEIAPLKKVLMHRPGDEFLNLTPNTLERLLFDDIPYLKRAREEHDEFARVLKENGVEVVYLENLMAEVIGLSAEIREEFLNQFIYEAGIRTPKYRDLVFQYLNSYKNPLELVLKTMEGIQIHEINRNQRKDDSALPMNHEDVKLNVMGTANSE